jgi:hypothetical protein
MLPGYGYINLVGSTTVQVMLPGYGYINGV